MAAVDNGDAPAVASILRHGGVARVLRARGSEASILLRAISSTHYRDDEQRARIVTMLADAGAELNDSSGLWSPVAKAVVEAQPKVVAVLLAKGADSKGLLHFAVRCNRLPIAQVAFASGAKPDYHDDAPVQAAENANAAMLAWLYKIGYPHGDEHGESPELLAAASSNCGACVALLLDAGVSFGLKEHPNIRARWIEQIGQSAGPDALDVFVRHGLPLDGGGEKRNGLLHYAALGGRVDTIKWLLARGLNVDARNEFGETPLILAAKTAQLDAVRALLEAKADIGLSDKDLRTAKGHAYREDGYDPKARAAIIALLEQHGASEYIGEKMPPSRFDPELDKDLPSFDITREIYKDLPMLAPNARFFNVTLKGRMASSDYAVLPGTRVVGLKSVQDFVAAGLQLRTKEDALHFVRFLSNYRLPLKGAPDFTDLPDLNCVPRQSTNTPEVLASLSSLGGLPNVQQRGAGAQAIFAIRRIVAPRTAEMTEGELRAKIVEETLSAAGGYSIRTIIPELNYRCEVMYRL